MEIQLELNIDNKNESDIKYHSLQKQIDEISESTSKVRRKLFAELGELKKLCLSLQTENTNLKEQLVSFKNDKKDWQYLQSYSLFDKVG